MHVRPIEVFVRWVPGSSGDRPEWCRLTSRVLLLAFLETARKPQEGRVPEAPAPDALTLGSRPAPRGRPCLSQELCGFPGPWGRDTAVSAEHRARWWPSRHRGDASAEGPLRAGARQVAGARLREGRPGGQKPTTILRLSQHLRAASSPTGAPNPLRPPPWPSPAPRPPPGMTEPDRRHQAGTRGLL